MRRGLRARLRPGPTWGPRLAELTLAVLAAGLLWRTVRYALGFPVWGDEAFVAVNLVQRDFRGLVAPLVYGQIVPLGFMWAELAVRYALGLSEWALRLLPCVAGAAALVLHWRLARRVLPRGAVPLAVGFLAASVYAVRHGAEIKPYATDLLVSVALTSLAWAVLRRPPSAWRWAALAALAGAGVWCSYPAVFVAGGAAAALAWPALRHPRAGARVGWLLYTVVLCASFAAMYALYARPHGDAAATLKINPMWTQAFPPLAEPWKLPVWLVLIHTGLLFAYPHGGTTGGSAATLVLFVIGCVRLWGRPRPTGPAPGAAGGSAPGAGGRERPGRQLVGLLLAPFGLALVAAALRAYPYGGTVRTSLFLGPAICLLAGLGLYVVLGRVAAWVAQRRTGARRAPRGLRIALVSATGALVLLALGGTIADILRPYKSAADLRSREAVRAVAQRSAAGDRWVVFNSADPGVDYAPYLGAWRGVGAVFVFDVLRYAPGPVEFAPRPETLALPAGGRLFLLAYRADSQPKGVQFPRGQWEQYLAAARARLGPPREESFPVKQDERGSRFESIEVCEFGRRGGP